jgi:hypothetical protein
MSRRGSYGLRAGDTAATSICLPARHVSGDDSLRENLAAARRQASVLAITDTLGHLGWLLFWEYLRGNKLAITVFDGYDDIVDKACDAWTFFASDPDRIASITTRSWATVTS